MQHLVVQIGLSGNRNVDISFWPLSRILSVALTFHRLLSPEFDDMDVKFVYEDRVLEMNLTVEEAGLTNGVEIRAIMSTSWKVQSRASTPSLAYPLSGKCACVHCDRRVMGWHFNVNLNAFKPAFKRGGKTRFSDVISCFWRHVDWDLEHNEGRMPADQVLMLDQTCENEWLWNCCQCNKMRLCASEHCVPIDMVTPAGPSHPWATVGRNLICCSSCAWMMPHAEIPLRRSRSPLANIDAEMRRQAMRQRPN